MARQRLNKVCINCGKEYSVPPSRKKSKYCNQGCSIEHQRGENAHTWRGGLTLNPNYSKEQQRKYRGKGLYTAYTPEEEQNLRDYVEKGIALDEIAKKMNRSKDGIKGKLCRMGIGYRKKWSRQEIELLKEKHQEGMMVEEISKLLHTTIGSVEWQITKIGIGAAPGSKEFSEKASKRNKRLWDDPSHAFNQPEYKEKLSANWNDPESKFNSSEYRQALSDRAKINKPGLRFQHNDNGKGRLAYGGFRNDLGHYVRSRWEANIARYLKWLIEKGEIKGYEYEPDNFEFHEIKRGNRSYTPDFKVYLNSGNIEYWEVKGYMDNDSKVKLKRMAKYYPNIKIVLIQKSQYKEITKWSGLIPNWE